MNIRCAATILGCAVTLACGRAGVDDGGRQVLHRALPDAVRTWDPANAYDSVSLDVVTAVYETLYQYDYLSTTYTIVPLLADGMPVYSADRLTVTFPLRHGVRFQDNPCFTATNGKGREITAEDFVYAWKRLALPGIASQGWWIFDGKVAGINAFHDALVAAAPADRPRLFDQPIAGLRAVDRDTLEVRLTKPYPQLLEILAMSFTAPVPREAVAAYADDAGNLSDHPVGTGPFVLKEWDRERRITLVRNPAFRGEPYPAQADDVYRKQGLAADAGKPMPFLDEIVVDVIKEQQPAWLRFLNAEFDLSGIPKDNFDNAIVDRVRLRPELGAKGIRLGIAPSLTFWYVDFNARDPIVGRNKKLRQAISMAIDRQAWIDLFTNGRGSKMTHALPPGISDRPTTSTLKYDFDLARAKQALADAGYPAGAGLPALQFDLRGADSLNRQLGEFLQSQLARIGVKLTPVNNTFPAFLEKTKTGRFQVSYGGWTMDYPDAENVFQLLYGPNKAPGPNDGSWDVPVFNQLYEQMAGLEPGPVRAALIAKMDDWIQEEVPWAYGYYSTGYYLTQPWLLNFRGSDVITNTYKSYRIDPATKRRGER